jgi:hypothetical protein
MGQPVGSWILTVFVLIALSTGTGHCNLRVRLYPTTFRKQSWIRQQNPAKIQTKGRQEDRDTVTERDD